MSTRPEARARRRRSARRQRSAHAFTLIELVVVMGIFLIIAGSILAIMKLGLTSSGELATRVRRDQQKQGFYDVVRRTLGALPSGATFTGTLEDGGDGGLPQIIMTQAPDAFALEPSSMEGQQAIVGLALRPQGGGTYAICIGRPATKDGDKVKSSVDAASGDTGAPTTAATEALASSADSQISASGLDVPMSWTPLIRDLSKMEIRYYNGRRREWQDDWRFRNQRPLLIEMMLYFTDDEDPQRLCLAMPQTVRRGQPVFQALGDSASPNDPQVPNQPTLPNGAPGAPGQTPVGAPPGWPQGVPPPPGGFPTIPGGGAMPPGFPPGGGGGGGGGGRFSPGAGAPTGPPPGFQPRGGR